jgi:hypothetical protein
MSGNFMNENFSWEVFLYMITSFTLVNHYMWRTSQSTQYQFKENLKHMILSIRWQLKQQSTLST